MAGRLGVLAVELLTRDHGRLNDDDDLGWRVLARRRAELAADLGWIEQLAVAGHDRVGRDLHGHDRTEAMFERRTDSGIVDHRDEGGGWWLRVTDPHDRGGVVRSRDTCREHGHERECGCRTNQAH
ncbi:MAG: hypothetical protein IPQ07_37635 [Myxococcales bacterium]|nr:hypothetical protein [Myxococcales bacterium]